MDDRRKITGDTRKLLFLSILYGLSGMLAAKFINIFLMRTMDNIMLVIGKNMLFALITLVSFLIGTRLLSKISVTSVLKIGVGLILIYYGMLLLLGPWLHILIVPLGMVNGLGNGFYWCAFNVLLARLATDENRGQFFGLQKVFNNGLGIFIPTVAGFVIVSFTDFTGYYFLFGSAILLLVATLLLTSRITGFKSDKQLNPLPVLKVKQNIYWKTNVWYSICWGFGGNIFMQTFTLFAFAITASELRIGNYSSMMAVVSLLSAIWVTKKIRPQNRKQVHLTGTIVYASVLASLAIFANELALIVAFLGVGAVQSWGMNISQSVKFQLVTLAEGDFTREEYLAAAEFPLALGRILGLTTALVMTVIFPLTTAYRILMVICGLCWIVDHLIVQKHIQWFKTT